MSKVRYSSGSIYVATPQTSWYLENLVYRDIQNDPSDRFIVIEPKYQFRPYNLSYKLYGSKDYWWVFQTMNMNEIRDPIYDFKAGIRIRVPTKERVLNNVKAVK